MSELRKHLNFQYTSSLPTALGDRYYSQDLVRDNLWLEHSANYNMYDLLQDFPCLLSGGTVTQGSGDTLNISIAVGYVYQSVTIPDTFSALPPSTTTADVIRRVVTTLQSNMAITSATLDGSTPNYVKVQYTESNLNSRDYAKTSGSYYYEVEPSFTITVDSVAPTNYDLVLARFSGSTGGTFTIAQYPARNLKSQTPIGAVQAYSGLTVPNGWLNCTGASISRISYSQLFDIIAPVKSGVTISIASPGIFTLANHGLQTYQCVSLETTGTLPAILSSYTNYYVHYIDANTFHLCTSIANVTAANYINTTGYIQSGTHSLRYSSYGTTGASVFNIPDLRGIHVVGVGTQATATGWTGTLSWHHGIPGYYDEDAMQKITGTFSGGRASTITAPTGAFSGTLSENDYTTGDTRTAYRYQFNSAGSTSPNTAKTSDTITKPARLGFYYIIKYV